MTCFASAEKIEVQQHIDDEEYYAAACQALCKRYRTQQSFAISNVSFGIKPGQVFGLLGPGSCGKSSVMKMFSGTKEPSSGKIVIGGKPISATTSFGMLD